jgi:histidine ammonia-lyase
MNCPLYRPVPGLKPQYFLGGELKLNGGQVCRAFSTKISTPLSLDEETAALGVQRIVDEMMAAATRMHLGVRGIILVRLANSIEGHAAAFPDLAVEVADLLELEDLPEVSLEGQGGAGEIHWAAPLFHVIAEQFPLAEKDSLSLINGSPAASAPIADAVLAMRCRLELVEAVFALSAEA